MPYPVGLIVMGGDTTATYLPDAGIQEMLLDNKDAPIWKLRLVVPSLKYTFLRKNTSLRFAPKRQILVSCM